MVTDIVSPSGLHGLCSKEQLHLLDAIDSLRSEGINHYISLPQIIVCGDQSSGKSSVLEAISGVSFPVKSNMCTRFPTELVLRKTASSGVNVSIVPHHSRSAAEKESMAEFSGKLEDFKELPNLIENAKAAMGIMALGKAFSNDLLRIEVSGPDRPHLTIVDLPGLIHSENKHQSAADVELIKDVVQGYMQEPRSIILAVVSAKNDYANQVVLKLARSADPAGKRTLGVITKPDTLLAGSGSETMYINLAGNKDVEFRLGWHVLRNADSEADSWTPAQRDAKEAEFFFSGNWQGVSQSNLGIKNLRSRLSKLLLEQISSELPNLIAEIGVKYAQCELKLKGLGQPRTSVEQQRTYLIEISQAFQEIVAAAVNGTYTDPFFDDPVSATGSKRRFRAVIQNLGGQFAEELLDEGRYSDFLLAFRDMPSGSGCEEVEKMVIDIMERGRGRELPGTFSPMIITDLFKKLSSSWEATLESHVQRVWTAAQEFLKDIVEHIADPDTKDAIWEAILMAKLNHNLALLKERVVALMKPHRNGHPITYNMDFQDAFKELQLERRRQPFKLAIDAFFKKHSISPNHRVGNEMNVEELVNDLITRTGWEETCSAGSKAVDMAQAYYDVALKRFIDDVAVEVVETVLVLEIAKFFDPLTISMMPSDEISKIAGEKSKIRRKRENLQKKLQILKTGAEICKDFAGLHLPVSTGDSEQEIDGPDPEDEAKSLASVNGGSEEPCLEDASEEPDQAAISPFEAQDKELSLSEEADEWRAWPKKKKKKKGKRV